MKNLELKNLDILIDYGELVSIIGPTGCGKTVILKMICGRHKNDYIYIDSKPLINYNMQYKKNNIVCVFDDNIYNTNNPLDELKFYLRKLEISDSEINKRVEEFIEYFNLEEYRNSTFELMSISNRILFKILSLLIISPKLFCIDDLLTYLDKEQKIKILNYIKSNGITLISVVSNMEELILFDKVLVMNKGKKVIFDKTEKVLCNEELFRELNIELPFIYDINNMLKSYDLIKENHLIGKELVDLLWK